MTRSFDEASRQIQASLQKHLESRQYFEDEDTSDSESNNEFSGPEINCDELLLKVFGNYANSTGASSRTKEALLQSLKSSASCLICISDIKRTEAIWTCDECYCILHMQCIQRWAKDSISQQKHDQESHAAPDLRGRGGGRQTKGFERSFHFGCPKCRFAYTESQIPHRYTCFCGKTTDPEFDPWIVPHSCGEKCGKSLKPECGHQCLILCHPGPCPPCPKDVKSKCFCGQSAPATKRCFDKKWSCGKPCRKKLNCRQHSCPVPCHEGEICPPCDKKSVQLCRCKKNQKLCDCYEPQWQCESKCGKKLGCGYHVCEVICHDGEECPPCPLSQLRHCPCGKSSYQLACTVATPTCGDTCGKVLACGSHVCVERCHRGSCGSCLQMMVKPCRCGTKKKEVACTKDYTCDIKCRNLKDCGKHLCNRKCCLGGQECPPCDQNCSKPLACKNHKCSSRCHQNSCYPCTLTQEVSCNCGSSRVLVPCGMERTTKPPKCKQKCKSPPECHHESRTPHSCHFGSCPPCKQICQQEMNCGHRCPQPCHDQVVVKVESKKASTPWDNTGPSTEVRNLDCPNCQYPVPVTCLGGHETSDWPCHLAKTSSCGRKCGRMLPCGNHVCERDCHRVKNASDQVHSGANCRKCESECTKPRPEGCNHSCLSPCHPGPCEPCGQMMRIWCNCGITQIYVKCGEWVEASESKKVELACCKDQCPKLMDCGHRCTFVCHTGDCSDKSVCKKKVKLFCPCKRRKQETPCNKAQPAVCDDECRHIKEQARLEAEAEQDRLKVEVERQQREEAERFEAKMEGGGRRRNRRNRRNLCETTEKSFLQSHKLPILAFLTSFVSVVMAIYLYQ